ncbi:hypothetical protein T01_8407, partial [Trichinella spiralis]
MMATRRRERGSEDESVKSNSGGRTGGDLEADRAAAPGGSLQWGPVREPVPVPSRGAYFYPPPAFGPGMDAEEWVENLEDFLRASGVPTMDHG